MIPHGISWSYPAASNTCREAIRVGVSVNGGANKPDPAVLAVYKFLLSAGQASRTSIANALGTYDEADLAEAVERLQRIDVVNVLRGKEELIVPMAPLNSSVAVLSQSVERIRDDADLVSRLLKASRSLEHATRSIGSEFSSKVQILRNEPEFLTYVGGCLANVKTSIDAIAPSIPPPTELEYANQADSTTLKRGVRGRTIGPIEGRYETYLVEHARKMARLGMECRVSSITPFRMLIFDSERAIIAWREDGEVQSLVVTEPHLVLALQLFFDQLWACSAPYLVEDEVSFALTDAQQIVLSLLADGYSNKAIAARLGKDERTVRRTVQKLLTLLDATSVFQLGAEAERRGWLN